MPPTNRTRRSVDRLAKAMAPARIMCLPRDHVLFEVGNAPLGDKRFLEVPRIRVFGRDESLSDFVFLAAFHLLNVAEPVLAAVGPESMRANSQANPGGMIIEDLTLGEIPDACTHIVLMLVQAHRHRRLTGVLSAIQEAAVALNYLGDPIGTAYVAQNILDSLDVLLQLDPAAIAHTAVTVTPSLGAEPRYLVLLEGQSDASPDPELWLKDNMVYEGRSVEGASEYQSGTSVLLSVGPRLNRYAGQRRQRANTLTSNVLPQGGSITGPQPIAPTDRLAELEHLFGREYSTNLPLVVPLVMELDRGISQLVGSGDVLRKEIRDLVESIRQECWYMVGFQIPGVKFRANDALVDGNFVIQVEELPVAHGRAYLNHRWCRQSAEHLQSYGLTPIPYVDPRTQTEACWLDESEVAKAHAAGFVTNDVITFLLDHLAVTVWNYAADLLSLDLVSSVFSAAPALLSALHSAPGGLIRMTAALRALLHERVPIREWKALGNRYLELVTSGLTTPQIVEELRYLPALRPSLPGNTAGSLVIKLSPALEAAVRSAIIVEEDTAAVSFPPGKWIDLRSALSSCLEASASTRPPTVVVEDPVVRPFVKLILNSEFPNLYVLSRREMLFPALLVNAPKISGGE